MTAASDFWENGIVRWYFRGASAPSLPANFFIALCTSAPTDASTGSTIVEPSGNGYARVSVANGSAQWADTSGTNATTSNVNAITFPSASGSWGTCSYVAICDASSAGNMLFWGALTSPLTVGSGTVVSFAANQLSIQLDN